MRVEFQLTLDDLVEANQYHSARGFERYRRWMFAGATAFVGGMIVVQVVFYQAVLNLVLAACALWLLSYSMVLRRARRRGVRRAWETTPSLRHPLRYDFTEAGVRSKSKTGQGQAAWSDIQDVLETPKLFLLYTAKNLFFTIPKRATGDAQQQTAFRNLLRSKVFNQPERLTPTLPKHSAN